MGSHEAHPVNPFPRGSWIACSGRLLGVLDRNLIQGPQLVDTSVRIPVVLPDDRESIRQSSLTAHNTTPIRPSTVPTTPRSTGPRGITSWNPFSSPVGGQNSLANKEKNLAQPRKHPDHEATEPPATLEAPPNSTTTHTEPVLTISSPENVPPGFFGVPAARGTVTPVRDKGGSDATLRCRTKELLHAP
ncbi:predicted protein [Chaetomium globosum CBS 148.51]|uniref:Uncharacterized protein n=1 Tax=Chaetomium globosum (strain ATCC 6205 / CBS 148.51 / DSM 1962 / NBRC 6347 / NRRL 1970) TaxID=306901 RepID=Q2GRV4_CHAGB|nr:uncharacterized protein CHGG_09300 [Chaetomium globosum CBS 148.51]EAQ85286.1 predicted protein [Chaetomium globosum CBS 148.51]